MSRRRKHTPEEALRLRSLIRDWKIDFESATALDDWDARHLPSKQIFEQILEIKKVAFAEYPQDEHSNEETAVRKKLLVRRLQANAARCRREKDNEAGWINNVANLVFESFNGFEFQWYVTRICGFLTSLLGLPILSRLSDFFKIIEDGRSAVAAQLVGQLAYVRPNSPSIFSNKSDERVIHNSAGLQKVRVDQKYKRPDRVYGLSITGSFDRFSDRLATYSPFSGRHTLFPFMVVEAKSEKSESGFHDIEQQTALSIRTCLKIQTDLEIESNQVLDPVVWFFGFKGDEWRLYLALPVNDRTKVIDCWHGCISKADEALQLLLIVDWICFWARDVHRKSVLKCLSGLEARETTPAATVFSSQGDLVVGRNSTRSTSLVFRSSRPANPSPGIGAQHNMTSAVIDVHELEDETMQDVPRNGILDHDSDEGGSNAVRSAHDVVYRWKCFALPEDDASMLECLSTLAGSDCIRNAARALWEMLTDERSTVKMSLKSISELLHSSTEQESTKLAAEKPMTTFLACQRRLTETSWQVISTYWCITCSQPAAQLLATIADIPHAEVLPLNLWRAHDCSCLVSAVADFRRLSGKASAAAAISQDIYCVRARTSEPTGPHLEWFKGDRDVVQPKVAMLESLFKHMESAQQISLPMAALCTSGGDTILSSQLFVTDDLDEVSGLILKKPESWPATCPSWCFLTFELGSNESIGQQIAQALQQKAIYIAENLKPSDEQSISDWASATKDVMQSIDVSYQ